MRLILLSAPPAGLQSRSSTELLDGGAIRRDEFQTNMNREEYRVLNLARFIRTASRIATGEIGVLAGVRQLVIHGREAGIDEGDPDFRYMIGIESESDHLPTGSARAQWDVEALRRKDFEIEEFEAQVKEDVIETCRRLVERFGSRLQA